MEGHFDRDSGGKQDEPSSYLGTFCFTRRDTLSEDLVNDSHISISPKNGTMAESHTGGCLT
jgi:hypothetical protein